MEEKDAREAILLAALFAKRVVTSLQKGEVTEAMQDAGHVAAITEQLTHLLCSKQEVRI